MSTTVELHDGPDELWTDVAEAPEAVPGMVADMREVIAAGRWTELSEHARIVVLSHDDADGEDECECEGSRIGAGCSITETHEVREG